MYQININLHAILYIKHISIKTFSNKLSTEREISIIWQVNLFRHSCKRIQYFFFYWNILDIQYYASFRCVTEWFDICIHYEMITMISLVTICPQQSYYNIIDHIPYVVYHNPLAYLFHNWRFVPLNPHHLFCPLTPSPLATTWVFSASMSLFSSCFVCFVF